ncbi:MAG: cysteine desulfurase-like protein [Rubripirellula sp.]
MFSHENVAKLRAEFPALKRRVGDLPAAFFDGPAGTQVPQAVADAITQYLTQCNANHDGVFATSLESDRWINEAHEAAADLIGTRDRSTIAFGGNMTSLTMSLSRALAQTWNAGDEIVLSRLEHDANFTPWELAARDRGVTVRYVDIRPEDCTLCIDEYGDLLNDKTRLVAVGCASNAVGTINPVKQICQWARQVGALSFLDAVHFAPHGLIDVEEWGCDFLACSAYKFFGPHVGMMYGRRELLESLQPYKLRPAPDSLPGRWMTGTQNHEGIWGTRAAIDYMAAIGGDPSGSLSRRDRLRLAFSEIKRYEDSLLGRLLDGLENVSDCKVWGITDRSRFHERCPTISVTHRRMTPRTVAERFAQAGLFVWHGNYYALPLTERLGVEPEGMVRIGIVHYNTVEEVDRLIAAFEAL